MRNVLESNDLSFVEEQQLIDKRCESRGFPIQPQDPWRVAWRKWMLLPITPHCSLALFQSPCLPFSSLEEGRMVGRSTCTWLFRIQGRFNTLAHNFYGPGRYFQLSACSSRGTLDFPCWKSQWKKYNISVFTKDSNMWKKKMSASVDKLDKNVSFPWQKHLK